MRRVRDAVLAAVSLEGSRPRARQGVAAQVRDMFQAVFRNSVFEIAFSGP